MKLVRIALVLVSSLIVVACSHSFGSISSRTAPQDDEWVTYGHDYGNNRFSTSQQINRTNVSQLVPRYVAQTGVVGPFEASPIVAGGVMYVSTPYDGIIAINATTGKSIWRRPPLTGNFLQCCGPVNRGVAISGNRVIIGQLDGVLVALDAKTGMVQWTAEVADNTKGYSITMAPLIYHDTVIVGVGGGEFGIRGFLAAYHVRDGKLKWRWYATDSRHWFGTTARLRTDEGLASEAESQQLRARFSNSWQRGGGGIWTSPAIDPQTRTIFVATGNPWPMSRGTSRPGDNLYTDSIVALDADTGRMKWYFQQTPHDVDDLDAASPPLLFDTVDTAGHSLRALGEIGKTGIFYILDRSNGHLIRQSRPLLRGITPINSRQRFAGGSTWSPVSFDPRLGYAIVTVTARPLAEGNVKRGAFDATAWNAAFGTVSAISVTSGHVIWQDWFNEGVVGGSLSTAGDLTFVGEGGGYFDALDTKTGERLWHFETGAGVNAPPITYTIDGHQYVAVAVGGNQQLGTQYGDAIFAFTLFDDGP